MTVPAAAVVTAARHWIGTPWRHQARERGIGVDCVGLAVAVIRETGAVPADYGSAEIQRVDYARNPRGDSLRQVIAAHCMPSGRAAPGTLLLFRLGALRHIAICAGETMIHADRHHGVVEVGYRHPWLHRTDSIWSLPGVDYPSPRA